jgi:hypothetical protein
VNEAWLDCLGAKLLLDGASVVAVSTSTRPSSSSFPSTFPSSFLGWANDVENVLFLGYSQVSSTDDDDDDDDGIRKPSHSKNHLDR